MEDAPAEEEKVEEKKDVKEGDKKDEEKDVEEVEEVSDVFLFKNDVIWKQCISVC